MKKYLLWDFDHTLAFRDGMWSATTYELLQENGFKDIGLDDIHPYLTKGFPWHSPDSPHAEFFKGTPWWDYMELYFSNIVHDMGADKALSDKIAKQIRTHYLDISKWHCYDDTIPCLEQTKSKGYENIIVSNHVPELADLVIGLGIEKYFYKIFSSANLGYEKPNIHMYRHVLDQLEATEDITMIGDSYVADVEGALNAGIKAILVRKENTHNYQNYCRNLDELFAYL